MRLGTKFFEMPTVDLAKALLGKLLVYGELSGKIVETEAYLFRGDPACHASRGRTRRNEPMFARAGNVYVYLIYGMHVCLNVVSGAVGEGEAVLIRAVEPVSGLDAMRERRGTDMAEDLCRGPGRLTRAFGITVEHNNSSLIDGRIEIHDKGEKPAILSSPRIGIKEGSELELRFFVAGSRFVSGGKRARVAG